MIRNQISALSIRLRLPLLICLLLAFVMLVFGYISYLGVKNASLKIGKDRLQALTEQLSVMFAASAGGQNSPTHMAGRNKAVKQFLLSNGNDSAASTQLVLERLQRDSTYIHVELLDAAHHRVVSTSATYVLPFSPDSILALSGNPDSARVGKMFLHHDSIFYPMIAPVYDGKNKLGNIINWRVLYASQKSLDDLSALLGTDAHLYLGNTDGSLWTDMVKPVSMPLNDTSNGTGIFSYERGKNKPVLASVRQIGNSQWMVAIELSKAKILEAANRFLYWMIIAGLVILAISAFIAWLLSKQITGPLNQLTRAASDIAAGNDAPMVQVNRYDELGKLARAFNAMNAQVNFSQRALEKDAHNYKILFEHNPLPMWIISRQTNSIINVNEAAIHHYGYTKQDFLQLKASDLIAGEEISQYQSFVNNKVVAAAGSITRHIRKDGTVILVEVISDEIVYEEQEAVLMLTQDITDKLITEARLVQHRMQQQEIIAEATVQAQEMEREAIGKELHDNVNQILASAKLYLELVRTGSKEDAIYALEKVYENVLLAISEVRQLSKQLVAPTLDDLLSNVLKEMFLEIQRTTKISIRLYDEEFDETLLNENMKLMIYRVLQEQMTNIIKHAKATKVSIRMENNKEHLSLLIEDNGVGFDTKKKSKGIGLRNIENRVRFYKGVTIISSKPGEGCLMEISVPMKREGFLVVN